MKYTLVNKKNTIVVVELPYNLPIKTFNKSLKQEAKTLCNFLNSGGGFAGFTPPFLVKDITT